jgi:hypothetical protein
MVQLISSAAFIVKFTGIVVVLGTTVPLELLFKQTTVLAYPVSREAEPAAMDSVKV